MPFRSTSDSEIIAALLATHPAERIEDAVADVLPRLQGAFSTVVMTEDAVVAFRDPHGLRPLALGMIEDAGVGGPAYCVASESCAFDLIGAKFLREVEPGEVVTLTDRGLESRIVEPARAPGVLRVRVHLLRAARLADGAAPCSRSRGPRWARSCGARRRSTPTS